MCETAAPSKSNSCGYHVESMKLQYVTAIHLETTVCVKATYVETTICATDTHVETVIS
jgi:hypothetical protein